MAPAIPAEGEFVEVTLQVLFPDAMQRADEPTLQVGERPVDPWQQNVRRHVADDLADVLAMFSQFAITREPVAHHGGATRREGGDERPVKGIAGMAARGIRKGKTDVISVGSPR